MNDNPNTISYSTVQLVLAFSNLLLGGILAYVKLDTKNKIQNLEIKLKDEIANCNKDSKSKFEENERFRNESSQRKYEKITNLEKKHEELKAQLDKEITILRLGERSMTDRLDKMELSIERLGEKFDLQTDLLNKIHEEIMKRKS